MKSQPKTAPGRVTDEDIAERVRRAVAAAESRKAANLEVLDLSEVSDFTDYFLIASGTNERQVQAIADGVERGLRDAGVRTLHSEGYSRARWVLLDYGDFVVHVFDAETRSFYGLERLWSDAAVVTARFVDGALEEPETPEEPETAPTEEPATELADRSAE